jgi:hypothetical protein
MQTETQSIPTLIAQAVGAICCCPQPLPRERADRKGASRTTCDRCGLPVPLRLPPAA